MPELLERLSNFDPVWDAMSTYVAQRIIQNWESQGATYGSTWPPLAQSTLKEKARLGYPETPLVRTGRLQEAIYNTSSTVLIHEGGISVGISDAEVPYAKYHNDPGPGSRIPQRILIAVLEEDIEQLVNILLEFLTEGLNLPAGALSVKYDEQ